MTCRASNRSLLAKVDDRQTIYGKGYVGWINKRRVLVGNRALMMEYGIKIPSLEYEQHHTVNQRRVIYLAVSGKLFAMFQVAYQRDPDTAAVLETLHHAGLSLVVDCDDFNCDVRLLETAYGLPAGSVKVLTSGEHQAVAPAVAWLPESEGNMLHLGSFASFVGGLVAAAAVLPRASISRRRADGLGAVQLCGRRAADPDGRHCRAAAGRHRAVSGRVVRAGAGLPAYAAVLRQHRRMVRKGETRVPHTRKTDVDLRLSAALPWRAVRANRWVRLADAIDWDGFEKAYSELFAPGGKVALPARVALGCRVIQLHYGVGPRGGGAGAGKPLPAVFFGI